MWERLREAIGDEALSQDARFEKPFDRYHHKDELVAILERLFLTRDQEDWLRLLSDHDIPHAPVLDYPGVAAHPQFWENGYLQWMDHPQFGRMTVVGPPVQMSATPAAIQGPPPEIGQHTEEILLSLGYTWPEITALQEKRAI